MKKIAYLIVDGREPDRIVGAYWIEDERNDVWDAINPAKRAYLRKTEQIVSQPDATKAAHAKLDALEHLLLAVPLANNLR